ncbi:MAG: Na+/H+ antiporter NhaC family protein, partial [Lachnospiraceae bacterium]|nr:Na+/H+ antiporter NhaC family protein [Lachnospiraceae bacterium]
MKLSKTTRRMLIVLVLVIFCGLLFVSTKTPGTVGEDYVSFADSTILALLPPVVAITLALITKEVYSSLFIGTAVGALLYAGGNLELALNTMLYHPDGGFVVNLTDLSHAGILVFVTILGSMVVLMNKSGSAAAFGKWASTRI